MYRINFTKSAIQDLEDAFLYIRNVLKNPISAENIIFEAELSSHIPGIVVLDSKEPRQGNLELSHCHTCSGKKSFWSW